MGAPSILAGSTSRKDVSKEMMAVAGGIGILAAAPLFAPVAIIGGATGAWLLKTIFDKKNRRRGEYVKKKKKKEMKFQSVEALQQVVNVVNEAAAAVSDKSRTIRESAIPEVLMGALGAGIGGVGSFAALYGLGSVVGLSAAGITSGLAAAGGLVGGGMVAGVFALAAPVAILAAGGVGLASHLKNKQLRQEKERLYKEALAKHQAIIKALKDEAEADKERLDYLQSLNILLARAIDDLQADLGVA